MSSWASYSYLWGPLTAFLAVGILALLLRWTFQRGNSLVARTPAVGSPDEYGLLTPVATPPSVPEGEMWRQALLAEGITATLSMTTEGPRLMVWPQDVKNARLVLKGL